MQGYRAKGRVHDMRTGKTKTKAKLETDPTKRAAVKARVTASMAGAAKAGKNAKNLVAKRGKVQKVKAVAGAVAASNADASAQHEADMQSFRATAANMSATRNRKQASSRGRAAELIKNKRA
jgi:hypothetical protein